MLEQYVSSFLATYLGKYIRGIADKQLRVSLWDGELKLHNLELRPQSLAPASLPIAIHRGYVGALRVNIPWTRLQSEPVTITIEKLYVVIRPKAGAHWDPATEAEMAKEKKLSDLQAYESNRDGGSVSEEGGNAAKQQARKSFAGRLQDGIANNVEVSVSDVHIRYEDADIDPHNPIALGFVMSEARCFRANSEWAQEFISEAMSMVHRVLALEGWGAYLHPCQRSDMFVTRFPSSAVYEQQQVEVTSTSSLWSEMDLSQNRSLREIIHSNLLVHPTALRVKLRVQQGRSLDLQHPRLSSDVHFDAIRCGATHRQYQSILHVVDYILNFEELGKLHGYRPEAAPFSDPSAWWRFAISSVQRILSDKRNAGRIDWESIARFKKHGAKYTSLFKRTKGAVWLPPLDTAEQQELVALHDTLSTPQLILLRDAAYAELEEERVLHASQRKLIQESVPKAPKSTAWFRGWGSSAETKAEAAEPAQPDAGWTQDDKDRLACLGLLDAAEGEDGGGGGGGGGGGVTPGGATSRLPPDYVEHSVLFDITSAEMQLLDHDSVGFSTFALEGLRAKVDSKAQGGCFKSMLLISNLSVEDGHRQVLRKRASLVGAAGPAGGAVGPDGGAEGVDRAAPHHPTLLLCGVERSPRAGGRGGISVDISLAPIDCLLHPEFASAISSFFRPPPEINLKKLALSQNLRDLALRQYEQVMHGSTCFDIKFAMEAGHLIIPIAPPLAAGVEVIPSPSSGQPAKRYPCHESGALVLTLGTVSLDSDRAHNASRAEKLASGAELSVDDLYQRYNVGFARMSAKLTEDYIAYLKAEGWRGDGAEEAVPAGHHTHEFVKEFDVNIRVERLLSEALGAGGGEPGFSGDAAGLDDRAPEAVRHASVESLAGGSSASPTTPYGGELSTPKSASASLLQMPLRRNVSQNFANAAKVRSLLLGGDGAAGGTPPPSLRVRGDVPSADVALSRQGLLSALYAADTLTVFVNRLSIPDMPDAVYVTPKGVVKGTENFFYQQLLLCEVSKTIGHDDSHCPAVVILRKGSLFVFQAVGAVAPAPRHASTTPPDPLKKTPEVDALGGVGDSGSLSGSQPYKVAAIYNLSEAPFGVAYEGREVVLTFPQIYTSPKVLRIRVSDVSLCRGLYLSLQKQSADTLHRATEDIQEAASAALGRPERVMMDISFDLKRFNITLYEKLPKEGGGGGGGALASLAFEGFHSSVEMRRFDQSVKLKLDKMRVETLGETGCVCVSSEPLHQPAGGTPATPPEVTPAVQPIFFDVTVTSCVEQSPMWSHNGPDTCIALKASSLHLAVLPGLAEVTAFLYDLIGVNKMSRAHILRAVHAAPFSYQRAPSCDPTRVEMQVTAALDELRLTCFEDVAENTFSEFMQVAMQQSSFELLTGQTGLQVKGVLGDAVAVEIDHTGGDAPITRPLLGIADPTQGSLIEILYTGYSGAGAPPDTPRVNGKLTALMRQIKSRFHFNTFHRAMHFATAGTALFLLKEVTGRQVVGVSQSGALLPPHAAAGGARTLPSPPPPASGAAAQATTPAAEGESLEVPSVMLLDLRLVNPLVSLPARLTDPEEDCLVAGLGDVHIKSELVCLDVVPAAAGGGDAGTPASLKEYSTRMTIDLRDVELGVHPGAGGGAPSHRIAENMHVRLTMLNYVTQPVNPEGASLGTMNISVAGVDLNVEEQSWATLLQVAARNVLSQFTPRHVPRHAAPPVGQGAAARGFAAQHKSILAVDADHITIRLAHPNSAGSSTVKMQTLVMSQREFTGCRGSELHCSIAGFSLDEVAPTPHGASETRPLLLCRAVDGQQGPGKVLIVRMRNQQKDGGGLTESNVEVQLGEPTLCADPRAIFLVQDALVSERAAEAVALMLSDRSANGPPETPAARLMHLKMSMQSMRLIGLRHHERGTGSGQQQQQHHPATSEFFKLTIQDIQLASILGDGLDGFVVPQGQHPDAGWEDAHLACTAKPLLLKATVGSMTMSTPSVGGQAGGAGTPPIEVLSLPTGPLAQQRFIDLLLVRGVHLAPGGGGGATPGPDPPHPATPAGAAACIRRFATEEVPQDSVTLSRFAGLPCGAVGEGFHQKVCLRVEQVHVLAVPGFWVWVVGWASEGALSQLSMLGTLRAERLKSRMQAPSTMQLAVTWRAPVITFPTDTSDLAGLSLASAHTPEVDRTFTLALGQLAVENCFADIPDPRDGGKAVRKESLRLTFTRLRLYHRGCGIGLGAELAGAQHDLIRDFTAEAVVLRSLGSARETEVRSSIGEIRLSFSDRQVALLAAALECQQRGCGAPPAHRDQGVVRSPRSEADQAPQEQQQAQQPSAVRGSIAFEGLSVALHTSGPGSYGTPMVEAAMRGVLIEMSPQSLQIALGSVAVTDTAAGRPVVTTLASSGGLAAAAAGGAPPCFTLALSSVPASEGQPRGDVVELKLHRLHCYAEAVFLSRVVAFSKTIAALRLPGEEVAVEAEAAAAPRSAPLPAEGPGPAAAPQAEGAAGWRKVTASMQEFALGVVQRPEVLAALAVPKAAAGAAAAQPHAGGAMAEEELLMLFELDGSMVEITTDLATDNHSIVGSMASFQLKDTSTGQYVIRSSWHDAFASRQLSASSGDSSASPTTLVDFQARITNTLGDGTPGAAHAAAVTHDKELSVTMRSLTFTFPVALVQEVQDYVTAGTIETVTRGLTPSAPSEATTTTSTTAPNGSPQTAAGLDTAPHVILPLKYTLQMLNPMLIFPGPDEADPEASTAVVADLGRIVVQNSWAAGDTPTDFMEAVSVSLSNMGLSTAKGNMSTCIIQGAVVAADLSRRLPAPPRRQHHPTPPLGSAAAAGAGVLPLSAPEVLGPGGASKRTPDSTLSVTITGAKAVLRQQAVAVLLGVGLHLAESAGNTAATTQGVAQATSALQRQAPPAPPAGSGGHSVVSVTIPVISATVCNAETGEEVAIFSLEGIELRQATRGAQSWTETCLKLRRIDLREIWRRGSQTTCRELCYAPEPTAGGESGSGGEAPSHCVWVEVLQELHSSVSSANVVASVHLPRFIFIPSLVFACYRTLYEPYVMAASAEKDRIPEAEVAGLAHRPAPSATRRRRRLKPHPALMHSAPDGFHIADADGGRHGGYTLLLMHHTVTLTGDIHLGYAVNRGFLQGGRGGGGLARPKYSAGCATHLYVEGRDGVNVIDVIGDHNKFSLYIHLEGLRGGCPEGGGPGGADPGLLDMVHDETPFIHVAPGVTLRFVDVNIVFCSEDPTASPDPRAHHPHPKFSSRFSGTDTSGSLHTLLHELCSCGERSYHVVSGDTTLSNAFYETTPPPPDAQQSVETGGGGAVHHSILRTELKVQFDFSFGVGMTRNLTRGGAPSGQDAARCVMLTGRVVRGDFSSSTTGRGSPTSACSFAVTGLCAQHLPVPPPKPLHAVGQQNTQHCPGISPRRQQHSTYILRPTDIEATWNTAESGDSLQLIVSDLRGYLCLSDMECAAEFLTALPGSGGAGGGAAQPSRQTQHHHPVLAGEKRGSGGRLGAAKPLGVTVTLASVGATLVDDTSGSGLPFLEVSLTQNIVKLTNKGSGESSYQFAASVACMHYNDNDCDWEKLLVEPVSLSGLATVSRVPSLRRSGGATGGSPAATETHTEASASGSFVEVNITPAFVKSLRSFLQKTSGIAVGKPLLMEPMFSLYNDCGRDIALASFEGEPGGVAAGGIGLLGEASPSPSPSSRSGSDASGVGGEHPQSLSHAAVHGDASLVVRHVPQGCGIHFDSLKAFAYVCVMLNPEMESAALRGEGGGVSADPRPWVRLPVGVVGCHSVGRSFIAETANRQGRKHITFGTAVTVVNHLADSLYIDEVGVVHGEGWVDPHLHGGESAAAPPPAQLRPPHNIRSIPHSVLCRNTVISLAPHGVTGRRFSRASLRYRWGSLLALEQKWCDYVVSFEPEEGDSADPRHTGSYACTFSVEKKHISAGRLPMDMMAMPGGRVIVHIHPLLRLTNHLPVDVHYSVHGAAGVIPAYGGQDDVKLYESAKSQAVSDEWPNMKLSLSAGCNVGKEVQTTDPAVVWSGPTSALSRRGCNIERLLERCKVLPMRDSGGYKFSPHLYYSVRGEVTLYAPVWGVNHTQHLIEIYPKNAVTPTRLLPKSETPLPVAHERLGDVDTLFIKLDRGGGAAAASGDHGLTPQVALDVGDIASGGLATLKFGEGEEKFTQIGVSCETITWPGTDATTRVVKFVPKWALHNKTRQPLTVRLVLPAGSRPQMNLNPGETKACSSSGASCEVELKYISDSFINNRFSHPFAIDKPDVDLLLRLNYEVKAGSQEPGAGCFVGSTAPDGAPEHFRVLRVVTALVKGTINVTFTEASRPPFLLENRTGYRITFSQQGVSPAPHRCLKPSTTVPYAQDNPFLEAVLSFRIATATSFVCEKAIRLSRTTSYPERATPQNHRDLPPVYCSVSHSADVGVTVVAFAEDHYIGRNRSPSDAACAFGNGVYKAMFEGFSVGLCLPMLQQDVACATIANAIILLKKNGSEQALNIAVGDVQVDDETEAHPVYPVVFQREYKDPADGGKGRRHAKLPLFFYMEAIYSTASPDVIAVRNLFARFVPMQLRVSDKFLSGILLFADHLSRGEQAGERASHLVPRRDHIQAKSGDAFSDTLCYIGNVALGGLQVTVSFMRQPEESGTTFTQYHSNRWWLGYILRSVESTTLDWSPVELREVSLPLSVMLNRISESYLTTLRYQVFVKIPWSTSFLGNPASTVRGIGQGLADLVSKPYQGITNADSVESLVAGSIKGVAEGLTSLVTHTTGGIAGSVSSLTRSLARTTSKWAFDPEWASDRQQHGTNVAQGVFDGVGGFFHSPVSGYNEDGLTGATAGLALGAVGLVTKPVTGVLDGVSDGLDWWAGRNQNVSDRARPPRVFLPKGSGDSVSGPRVDRAEVMRVVQHLRRKEITAQQAKTRIGSFEVMACVLSWDEFRAACTVEEFCEHAHLARDAHLTRLDPHSSSPAAAAELSRVQHLYTTLGAATLSTDPSLQVGHEELAAVTTWEEFRTLLTEEAFYEHAHHARDVCIAHTVGFKLL